MVTTMEPVSQSVFQRGALTVIPFPHPQGCRSYLLADPEARQAMAIDPHLDFVESMTAHLRRENWKLAYVLDTHTHADHPSGSGDLAKRFAAPRIAHPKSGHAGLSMQPRDGETLRIGALTVTLRYAPGHTPDHLVVIADGVLFSGDTLFIGGVARTDFLGGDAGQLFDTIHCLLKDLPADTVLFPGHDYAGRARSTLAREKESNPWLAIRDRDEFIAQLTANPPARPANMDDLLRLNREGVAIPAVFGAGDAITWIRKGGAGSIIDVRTPMEIAAEHIPGSRYIPLDELDARADEIRAAPAPRLLLCRTGSRAEIARARLAGMGIGGLSVIEGGMEAFREAGGETARQGAVMSLERQVRIAAGSLVLLGVGLGFLHPAWLGISLFVGAGLVFAGVTDRCGMALLLAKLPWNRVALPVGATGGGTCAASACAANPPSAGGCAATLPKSGK